MATLKHVLKRILMMLAGYFVAVLVGLIAVVVIYSALSALPNAPDYFGAVSLTPIALLFLPPAAMIIYFVTIALTAAQSVIFALIAEIFSLRNFLMHMLFGAAAAAGGYAMLWPSVPEAPERWADMGIVAGAGLVAGLIYWLIAGREAGFRRPLYQRFDQT